ncbi:MAG: class II aldolase/adducin family protein [Candidatus Promineifilaceae bacterium]|nr:class II aldolase/adducin family protein [Candidatus Promineifilaceae bacterium]
MNRQESTLRLEVVRIGQLMYEKGFICASDGNISVRLDTNRILTTPSGLHKGFLEPEHLVVVDLQGRVLEEGQGGAGPLQPTSELPMHLAVYLRRPELQAVLHAHPPITIALSIAEVPLTTCLLPEVIVTLGLIPVAEYATPSSEENVRAIQDLIVRHDALVLKRHGALTVGGSLMEAFMRLETVEQQSRITLTLAQLGVERSLGGDELRKLLRQREAMGLARPGEEALFCEYCDLCPEDEEDA